jgi:hypothetical protein
MALNVCNYIVLDEVRKRGYKGLKGELNQNRAPGTTADS